MFRANNIGVIRDRPGTKFSRDRGRGRDQVESAGAGINRDFEMLPRPGPGPGLAKICRDRGRGRDFFNLILKIFESFRKLICIESASRLSTVFCSWTELFDVCTSYMKETGTRTHDFTRTF